MKSIKFRTRQGFLIVLLVIVTGMWAYSGAENARLRRSLEATSQSQVRTYTDSFMTYPGANVVTRVTTAHEYVLFGTATGKVEIYLKYRNSDGLDQFSGMELGYAHDGKTWVMTDSASCHGPECVSRGKQLFGDPI
ncbi:MAG: hypothetical protein IT365_02070 [Candidatus Hydrogenedentes bacterium]|nr:hypothetical protein [Candidatus Hydrogenedentota bacterium]